jgi:hypothetical protein
MGVKEKVIIFTEELAAVIVLDKFMDSVKCDSVCEAWN